MVFLESESQQEAAENVRLPQVYLERVAVIVLGGGEGKRLFPLTKTRCKPAMSFGGRYCLIDIPISHSIASGLNRIFVIGQYLAYSLQKHLFKTYHNHTNHVEMLVPEERNGEKIWFKGTADAIRQNLKYFSEIPADYFLILSGDQLYNINFQEMIQFAMATDAGMVIAAQPVSEKDAKRMGILKIEHGGTRLVEFTEKPQDQVTLGQFRTDDYTLRRMGYEPHGKNFLGSMGIYLFKRHALFQLLKEDPREDFGHHLIGTEMKKEDTHAYLYDGYWEDIGTIESYYHANLALTQSFANKKARLECYDESNMIRTQFYNLPGAKISDTSLHQCLLCEGTVVEGKEISHSIVGVRTVIKKGSIIKDSILMGNEYYERSPLARGEAAFQPGIGENCLIEKTIIDENVRIGNNVQLVNKRHENLYDDPEGRFYVREGILIVPRGTEIPDNFAF